MPYPNKALIILFSFIFITLEIMIFYQAQYLKTNLDARPYFEEAQTLIEKATKAGLEGEQEFYGLAQVKLIEAISKEPGNAMYHQRLGSIYVKLADTQKAEREFNNAVFLDPKNIRLRLYLAQYFFSTDNQEFGLFHLNKAVSLYKTLPHGSISNEVEAFAKSVGQEELLKK